jgi:hypothetical protein
MEPTCLPAGRDFSLRFHNKFVTETVKNYMTGGFAGSLQIKSTGLGPIRRKNIFVGGPQTIFSPEI